MMPAGGAASAADWTRQRAAQWTADPPQLNLQLADPHAFLDAHGDRLGAHARNIRHIAAPVSTSPACAKTVKSSC